MNDHLIRQDLLVIAGVHIQQLLDGGDIIIGFYRFFEIYPRPGWVEHDPEAIWKSVLEVAREAFAAAEARGLHVAAIGLTNQRETALAWDRASGRPVHNAIVWQDRRTAAACNALRREGREDGLPPVLVEQVRHLEREIDRTTRVLQTLKTTTGPLR